MLPTIVQRRIRVATEASAGPALPGVLELVAAPEIDEDALDSAFPMRGPPR